MDAVRAKLRGQSTSTRSYLMQGDRGDSVKKYQSKLKQAGYKIDVDGIFGSATKKAVEDFQRSNSLAIDGIIGAATKKKLEEMLRKQKDKELDEMAQQLPATQKEDMKKLLTKAYNTRDDKGNRIFSVDHTSKVDKMTRGQAVDLAISYVARTAK